MLADGANDAVWQYADCSKYKQYSTDNLKVKDPDIYILPLTGKPEQQRFTIRSRVFISISRTQHSAISNRPLPIHERTLDLRSAARQTHLCLSQPHYDLHPAMTK